MQRLAHVAVYSLLLLAACSCAQREPAAAALVRPAAPVRPGPIVTEVFRDLPDPEHLLGRPFSFLENAPHPYGKILSRRRIDLGDYVWNPAAWPDSDYLGSIATKDIVVFEHLEVGIGLRRHITFYDYR
ncbi:hypothetical protein LBMAG53_11680 [Planctomycetota bacterium]|nr:hypothetical protein LBMAG53_11680 [Planctomycetota bacterium]